MRAVPLLASVVLVLVLAAATVDASVLAGKSKAPASAAKKSRGEFIHPSKMRGGPQGSDNWGPDNWGPVYNMAYNLMLALQVRNFTAAASLIEDDAFLAISAIGCGQQSKAQVLAAAANDGALATYFQFGAWAGYEQNGMGSFGTIASVQGEGELANQTFIQKDVVFYFAPNQAGTKLSIVEQITDRSWAQPNNASKMANVWFTMAEASQLQDNAAFAAQLRPDAQFFLNYAWNQFPHLELDNKTAIMNMISTRWASEAKATVATNFVLVNCDFVMASFTWSGLMKDGTAQIMNFLMSVVVDENMKILQFSEFPLMPFV